MDISILRQIRWAVLLLSVGSVLGFVGGCYYLHEPSVPSAIATLVGVPMALLGLALKGAELPPLNLPEPTPEMLALRNSKATPTQQQILDDVTRFQYGVTTHLEPALETLRIESAETDEHPPLLGLREVNLDGAYGLALAFGELEDFGFQEWKRGEAAMTKFFGPDVRVEVAEPDDGQKDYVKVMIISTK